MATQWAARQAAVASVLAEGVASSSTLVSRAAQEAAAAADNTTSIIEDLQFSSIKSIRTSIITLASFNVLAAAVTLACIVWDCYLAAKRKDQAFKIRWRHVGAPQVYPFVLCLSIIAQGIIFATAQAQGLAALRLDNCVALSQTMMPATFLVPFTQLILGLETTIRSVLPKPFPSQRAWNVPLCIVIIAAGLFALWGVTLSFKPPALCFASLFWFTQAWRPVCLGLFVAIASTLLIAACVVLLRLRYSAKTPSMDRMAASHMVYYMIIAAISNALLTPFFFSITFADANSLNNDPTELSTVSSIVANLSGLLTGGLYLFLRGGRRLMQPFAQRTDLPEKGDDILGSNKLGYAFDHDDRPKTSSSTYSSGGSRVTTLNQPFASTSYGHGGRHESTISRFFAMPIKGLMSRGSSAQHSLRASSAMSLAAHEPADYAREDVLLPSTTYTRESSQATSALPNDKLLVPPPLFHAPAGFSHNRGSSLCSTATLQIGLRISNVNDCRRPSKADTHAQYNKRPTSPLLVPPVAALKRTGTPAPAAIAVPRIPHHAKQESISTVSLNKELPEVPAQTPVYVDAPVQLAPSVYSPTRQPAKTRLASPKGVGFHGVGSERNMPPGASPELAKGSDDDRAEWI
ncbi:uncharacterized protein J7T54_002086 [Emericellopsis cladophorae]|uniref:Uncharacterized protein n=1 Tax=Emericellopsis cladophorae TaxID=2686198 RepID=A0A9Q0BEH1_9HYPO|nr:uncharacterized protein J7T54_002086 [Emericellopsis cladophorae]KAI6782927.1 hypothetical protein J7T54_002086 [Emericellopsis cladophorae]